MPITTVTLRRSEYESLLAAARGDTAVDVVKLSKAIDLSNGIKRYTLALRWQDVGGTAPPRIELGKGWPKDQTHILVLERPIQREDVDLVVSTRARNPVGVMVTPDPRGEVGWCELEEYDFTLNAR